MIKEDFVMVPVHKETKRRLEKIKIRTGTSYDFLVQELLAKMEVQ